MAGGLRGLHGTESKESLSDVEVPDLYGSSALNLACLNLAHVERVELVLVINSPVAVELIEESA